ncbi:MAG: hypothetical protein ACLQGU_02550 [bacterium]
MKILKINGAVTGGTVNFYRVEIKKVEALCPGCGNKAGAQNPFGNLFIPRSMGIPDQIRVVINLPEKENS